MSFTTNENLYKKVQTLQQATSKVTVKPLARLEIVIIIFQMLAAEKAVARG